MSQLTAVDISDSDRFELAQVLKDESESSSAPRPLEDILEEACDDDFDPMSQRSCYELLAAYIARPIATIVSRNGHSPVRIAGWASHITSASPRTVLHAVLFSASDWVQPFISIERSVHGIESRPDVYRHPHRT